MTTPDLELTDADRAMIAKIDGYAWTNQHTFEEIYRAGLAAGMKHIADALDKRMVETNGCAECARFVRGIVGYDE